MDGSSRAPTFTLFQLFVVISVLALIMAVSLPSIQAAREESRKAQCTNNLKSIGVALLNYEDTYRQLPFNSQSENKYILNGQKPGLEGARGSVLFKVLPFMLQDPMYGSLQDETNNFRDDDGLLYRVWKKEDQGRIPLGYEPYFTHIHVPSFWCPSADSPKWNTNAEHDRDKHALACYAMSVGAQRRDDEAGCNSSDESIVGPLIKHCGDFHSLGFEDGPGAADWGNDYRIRYISGAFSATYYGATLGEFIDGTSNTIVAGEFLPNRTEDAWQWGWMIGFEKGAVLGTAAPCNAPARSHGGRPVAPHESIDPTGTLLSHPCAQPGDHIFGFGFKSMHAGNGCNILLGDGSVMFVSQDVDYEAWQNAGALADKSGTSPGE